MGNIQSLARGLTILVRLAEAPEGLGITELAEEYQVDKASMSRLLQTLAAHGFAEKEAGGRRYILGPQIVRLSRVVLTRMPLRETAKPYLRQLVDSTGECAHLAILAQGQALYIDQVESSSALRVTTGVGHLAPLYCTALGKILLAFVPVSVPDNLKQYTPRTITDPRSLQHHIETVKNQGYAVDDEEYELGVLCIAIPVFDYRGKCVAAMGISGPVSRLPLEVLPRVISSVQEIGKSLSAVLSFSSDYQES
jgi:IclR family acetate operon transcriptional repressor